MSEKSIAPITDHQQSRYNSYPRPLITRMPNHGGKTCAPTILQAKHGLLAKFTETYAYLKQRRDNAT